MFSNNTMLQCLYIKHNRSTLILAQIVENVINCFHKLSTTADLFADPDVKRATSVLYIHQ